MSSSTNLFQWKQEHQSMLENIAKSDIVETEWSVIRDAVKHKVIENTRMFLETTRPTSPPPPFPQIQKADGSLIIAPFPPHKMARVHLNEKPIGFMTPEQAEEAKKYVFEQLDTLDSTPFTIQRLCELCVDPRANYNCVGKYLRAVEKSILVTSSWDSFPPLTEQEKDSFGRSAIMLGSTRQSAPATPLFSPIPFSHEDARRSASRSPPASPLTLSSVGSISAASTPTMEPKALGLVDEMDDPGPGHLSEHPTPLTSVTDLGTHNSAQNQNPNVPQQRQPRSFLGSLDQRFVRSTPSQPETEDMMMDEDKENTNTTRRKRRP